MNKKNDVTAELHAYLHKDGSFSFDYADDKAMTDAQLLYVARVIENAADEDIKNDLNN